MTTLQNSSLATSSTATEGDVKSFLANLRTFVDDLLGSDSSAHGTVLQSLRAVFSSTLAKTAAYTITDADRGKVISFSGSGGVTLTTTAAATLGDGFVFAIANNASGTITIDPSLSETINGTTTYVVNPSETVIVFCDGTKFLLFGKAPSVLVSTFNTRSGAVTLTSGDISTALGYTPANASHSHSYAGMNAIVSIASAEQGRPHLCTRADGSTTSFTVINPLAGG